MKKLLLISVLLSFVFSAQAQELVFQKVEGDSAPSGWQRSAGYWKWLADTSDSMLSKKFSANKDWNGLLTVYNKVYNDSGTTKLVFRLRVYDGAGKDTLGYEEYNMTWYDLHADTSIGDTIATAQLEHKLVFMTLLDNSIYYQQANWNQYAIKAVSVGATKQRNRIYSSKFEY